MSCNPCCCWKLKDAAVSIGIWSASILVDFLLKLSFLQFLMTALKSADEIPIYAMASMAMYAWQWGVLSQCQHVTMAQSNLQCEYYCPCVGATTARTSAIIEGKDRSTLLSNWAFSDGKWLQLNMKKTEPQTHCFQIIIHMGGTTFRATMKVIGRARKSVIIQVSLLYKFCA
ncbi:hypothetical protein M3Y97_00599700 [Aphelenchoides bicaudatus]|nr:hypothetical protein M3Y97_00599700 [Aphelenchoides bicaudatus]